MLLELLSGGIASELFERTASTPAVQKALQSSLAPAFLLVGIGSIMNVIVARLNWIAGRIERLEAHEDPDKAARVQAEIDWLYRRRLFARRAIMLSSLAAVIISVVIALLFVSTYVDAQIGTLIAVLWVVTIALLITGLGHFLRETSIAARGSESFRKKR
ncbi:DUF2721 domain-containing protein [Erythrobacter sp. JK5]|uniref:DUF2721 domain-containing protein n=1 Tax=Erythrobacter sp. JK5 TaxID=2829500 RepID=UPI001BA4447D|nr:DUF2721 domain-containing protein [Erythrobacter sp. JK5]QUL36666.1 DUF2721 domain-containing protein [Erythrobacter sp. JK5]